MVGPVTENYRWPSGDGDSTVIFLLVSRDVGKQLCAVVEMLCTCIHCLLLGEQ